MGHNMLPSNHHVKLLQIQMSSSKSAGFRSKYGRLSYKTPVCVPWQIWSVVPGSYIAGSVLPQHRHHKPCMYLCLWLFVRVVLTMMDTPYSQSIRQSESKERRLSNEQKTRVSVTCYLHNIFSLDQINIFPSKQSVTVARNCHFQLNSSNFINFNTTLRVSGFFCYVISSEMAH